MKKIVTTMLLSLLVSGCASNKAWKYGPEVSANAAPLIEHSLVVPPFNDQRLNQNSNKIAMYFIPLVPYGWQELDSPEGVNQHISSGLWQWRPNEDIAKASAEEIDSAHIFRESFFSHRSSDGDLVLLGTIKSSKYDGKLLTYGLSVYGPDLWLFLPATNISNELVLSFKLEDRQSHRALWEREYRSDVSKISWIYNLQSDFDYPELLKKILLQAVKDLKADIPKIRNSLLTVTEEKEANVSK